MAVAHSATATFPPGQAEIRVTVITRFLAAKRAARNDIFMLLPSSFILS
jgi:hypothetical protein